MADKLATASERRYQHHLTFFRQSGWLMLANLSAGALMYALHRVASRMPDGEYGLFTTLLQVIAQISIPAVGLQGVFAQQAAASLNPEHEKELAGVARGVLCGTFFIWLLTTAFVWLLHGNILSSLKIADPTALWLTVLIGLIALWRPVVNGILQGRQNFLWLGSSTMVEGLVRFLGVSLIVGLLSGHAAGAVAGVLLGSLAAMLLGGWFCRDCLTGPVLPMNWRAWLARVVPLSLGLGVATFMLTADMLFVRLFFPASQTDFYAAAGMIGRGLIYFVGPIVWVMFPKMARSAASGERSQALLLALGATALAAGSVAVVCSIVPWLPLRIVYDKSFVEVSAPLVPWFVWSMVPLTLANVLINSLMAQSRFAAVPWMIVVALAYGLTLYFRHDTLQMVIQILGIFSLILCGVCAWFTFHKPKADLQ